MCARLVILRGSTEREYRGEEDLRRAATVHNNRHLGLLGCSFSNKEFGLSFLFRLWGLEADFFA